jgi:hypothetical protein
MDNPLRFTVFGEIMIKRSLIATAITSLVLAGSVGTGCKATGVGDPCIPEREYEATFSGFNPNETITESGSFQCQTRLCLVYGFRGRVTCPLGQDREGNAPTAAKDPRTGAEAKPCVTPGTETPIVGDGASVQKGKCVASQCADRTAENAVYCSCRCANADGKTDDGGNYCTCPENFACQQLVAATGKGNEGLTGAYCIKAGKKYDRGSSCSEALDGADPSKCL